MAVRGPYEIVHNFLGLSTDTKPTEQSIYDKILVGDRFFETDTRNWYIYDGVSWSLLEEVDIGPLLYGQCSTSMSASTTTLVAPNLAGYGDDFFNTKFYIQVVKNANSAGNAPERQVRMITDYDSETGTFTTDAFGANVEASDELLVMHESLVVLGRDDSDNAFASSNVAANADGSIIERLEWIQVALGGTAMQLRVQQSASGVVEETDIVRFAVALMDMDSGAIASADITITSITQAMERSRNGSAYSAISDPTVSFSKADGLVYMDYEFKATQWQVGDMYRMSLSGITCTIAGDIAYVPAMIWNNIVVEAEDLTLNTQYLYGVADGGTTSSVKVIDNSILSILMTKQSGGDTSDFDNSTDSFEAISDKIGAFTGDGGAAQDDSIKASLDLAHTDLDALLVDTAPLWDTTLTGASVVSGSLASFVATGGTALGTVLPVSTSLYDTVKNVNTVGVTSAPVANTLADILHKDGSFTFDNTTDSLEAISDSVTSGTFTVVADSGTSSIVVDATYSAYGNDYFNGCLLICTSGTNVGQARPVVDFATTSGSFIVSPPFASAVVATDTFSLISGWKSPEWVPLPAVPINTTAVVSPGVDVVDLKDTDLKETYCLNSVRFKFANPGSDTITITLSELINDVAVAVDTFTVTTDNYTDYHSLVDMFGLPQIVGDAILINVTTSAGSYALTGQYHYDISYN